MIQIEPSSITAAIQKIINQNKNISGDILDQAVARALNRSASSGRTQANQNIRKTYNISAARVNNEFSIKSATKSKLIASINAKGGPLSLTNFQARQEFKRATTTFNRKGVASSRLNRKSRNNAIKGVSATIRKGQTINIPTAFIQVSNGGINVFARGYYKGSGEGFEFTKPRLPIARLTTASIPLMFGNDDVMKPTQSQVISTLEDRINHEIKWLLTKSI